MIGELKKLTKLQFKPISADLAIDLYAGLLVARRTKLQPALSAAVEAVGVRSLDEDLKRLAPQDALTHLAKLGLRGERAFPVPSLLRHNPSLIGYYRMLLGLSQKEFGQLGRLGYGPWINAENTGKLSRELDEALDLFCQALIAPLSQLVLAMGDFSNADLNDLSLLTLGPSLQGGRNNVIGSKAAQAIFDSIRSIVGHTLEFESPRLFRFQSATQRVYELIAGSEPDISLNEHLGAERHPLLAIEVKGGQDASNAYNRAGEAEKSHLSAKLQGYDHRWTIMHLQGVDKERMALKTPSSTEIFEAADILSRIGSDWTRFRA